MDFIEDYAEAPERYFTEKLARYIEAVVRRHPDGARWTHLAAIIRSHPDRAICVPPSTRIAEWVESAAAAHVRT